MTSLSTADQATTATNQSPTRRSWLWFSCQVILRVIFVVWLRYRVRGLHNLPQSGGGLLLINHQSLLDPFLVGLPLNRPVSYLARDTLFRIPVVGWMLRHTYVMPINRLRASSTVIREAIGRLEQGYLVGIFPEGTRSAAGQVETLKPGFLAIVRRVNVPIVPVGVEGAHKALGRGSWVLRPHTVRVVFGRQLTRQELDKFTKTDNKDMLLDLVKQRIEDCQCEARDWSRYHCAR